MARRRYQRGALRKEAQKWIVRWREDVLNSSNTVVRVERRATVGLIADLPTKALARRAADKIVDHVNAPDYRPGRVITMAEFAEIYVRDVAPTFKASAAKAVRSIARIYIVPTVGSFRLDEVHGRVPQLMVNAMRTRGLSRKTIKNAIATLSGMLTAARGWGYVATKLDWDTLFLPTPEVAIEPRCFTPDEAQRIIDASPWPWRACFGCMAYLGLRVGETLALTWDHVDLAGAVLLVRQSTWYGRIQTVKSKTSRRDLPIPIVLVEMLRSYRSEWRPNTAGYLFTNQRGTPIGAHYLRRKVLHPIRDRLGIARGAFHAFRHGHATILFSEGGANPKVVQDSMGHADLAMTMRYTHAVPNDRRQAVERASQAFVRRSAAYAPPKSVVVQ